MTKPMGVIVLVGLLLAAAGCVERKMVIRSEPPGAPVWIDEQYAGTTPLEYPFSFYGARRVRVGPMCDENDRVTHEEKEGVWELEPPWYQKFPVDFFFEVLSPKKLVDVHELPVFVLPPMPAQPTRAGAEAVDEVRAQGRAFRDRALLSIPESPPR